jgi:hypothetical protein
VEGQIQKEKEEVMGLKCVICKKDIVGYSNKKTCGPSCKKVLNRRDRIRKSNDEICSLFG